MDMSSLQLRAPTYIDSSLYIAIFSDPPAADIAKATYPMLLLAALQRICQHRRDAFDVCPGLRMAQPKPLSGHPTKTSSEVRTNPIVRVVAKFE